MAFPKAEFLHGLSSTIFRAPYKPLHTLPCILYTTLILHAHQRNRPFPPSPSPTLAPCIYPYVDISPIIALDARAMVAVAVALGVYLMVRRYLKKIPNSKPSQAFDVKEGSGC